MRWADGKARLQQGEQKQAVADRRRERRGLISVGTSPLSLRSGDAMPSFWSQRGLRGRI